MKTSIQLCKYLRTKKMYIPALAHEVHDPPQGESSHTSHWWCNRTLTEVGPDDHQVGCQVCSPQRRCFCS